MSSKRIHEILAQIAKYEDAWRMAEMQHDYEQAEKYADAVLSLQDELLDLQYASIIRSRSAREHTLEHFFLVFRHSSP